MGSLIRSAFLTVLLAIAGCVRTNSPGSFRDVKVTTGTLKPGQPAHRGTEWPKGISPLVTNQIPATIEGIPQGFLGASFHIEQFDPKTTVLQGVITLTNLTGRTNSVVLSLKGPCIAGQIEVRDAQGSDVGDPNGIRYNWKAQKFDFVPHEVKQQEFTVRLKDYFDLKPGMFQLLFVLNTLQLGPVPKGEFHIKPWSSEYLVFHCE